MFQVTIVPLVPFERVMNPAHCRDSAGELGGPYSHGQSGAPAGHSLPNADTRGFFITSWDAQHDGDTASTQEGEQPSKR